jgi:hypothetical protein
VPLYALAAHDGVWVVIFMVILVFWRYGRSNSTQPLPAQ